MIPKSNEEQDTATPEGAEENQVEQEVARATTNASIGGTGSIKVTG